MPYPPIKWFAASQWVRWGGFMNLFGSPLRALCLHWWDVAR